MLLEDGKGISLYLPHYWAIYLHDGRGSVRPVRARRIVYFPNVKQDPRVDGGKNYPVQRSDIVRFTKEEYYEQLEKNRRKRRPDNKMRTVKATGPAEGKKFFSEGMRGVLAQVPKSDIVEQLTDFIIKQVPTGSQEILVKL